MAGIVYAGQIEVIEAQSEVKAGVSRLCEMELEVR